LNIKSLSNPSSSLNSLNISSPLNTARRLSTSCTIHTQEEMALEQWALPKLSELLPLDEQSLKEIVIYTKSLPDPAAAEHLRGLLGDSPQAFEFIESFNAHRAAPPVAAPPVAASKLANDSKDSEPQAQKVPDYAPPKDSEPQAQKAPNYAPPSYPPSYPTPSQDTRMASRRPHTNPVIEAAHIRARDEVRLALALCIKLPIPSKQLTSLQQQMQNLLQNLQMQYGIYNSEIDPEHEADYYCNCPIHNYKRLKYNRYGVQDMWSRAVMYPG
jgi:hypothetical protein